MRFRADQSSDFAVAHALRAAGHDVVAVAEVARGADDSLVIELAQTEGRILLTEDKDSASSCSQRRTTRPAWFCFGGR